MISVRRGDPRVEYRPTEKGEALRPVLEAVADWIAQYEGEGRLPGG